jgi:hypothetical protein
VIGGGGVARGEEKEGESMAGGGEEKILEKNGFFANFAH